MRPVQNPIIPFRMQLSPEQYARQRERLVRVIDNARRDLAALDAMALRLEPMAWPKGVSLRKVRA